MISLAPNQRLEVIPSASVKLRYAADTRVLLDASETRERVITANAYEASASAAARILANTAPAGDRVVASFRIACVDYASITVTLRRVTVPPVLVGQTWPGEQIEVLDTVTIQAGAQLLAEKGDAGWRVRVPAPVATVPAPGSDGLIGVSAGGAFTWAASIPFASVSSRPTTLVGYGITDAQPLDDDLTALAALATSGMVARTGAGAFATRTITGTTGQITVTNGSGISGSPVISLPSTITQATTFQAASGVVSRAAATQDGIILAGRAGGTTSLAVSLTPATLTANRVQTLQDAAGTVALLEVAQTWPAAQTIDRGTGALPAPTNASNILLTLSGAAGTNNLVEAIAFGGNIGLSIRPRIAGGTRASPSAVVADQSFFDVSSNGYDGSVWQNNNALCRVLADGLWSGTNRGTYYVWQGTPNGSTTASEWMRLQGGALGIGVAPTAGAGSLQVFGECIFTGLNTVKNVIRLKHANGAENSTGILFSNQFFSGSIDAGHSAIYGVDSGTSGGGLSFCTTTNGSGASGVPTQRMFLDNAGNLGIGLTPTAGNGLLQLASGTTRANGWALGSDVFGFRSASNVFALGSSSLTGVEIDTVVGTYRTRAVDGMLICKQFDTFTSGAQNGLGRWGLLMTPSSLESIIPAAGAARYRFRAYNADSTVANTMLTLSNGGVGFYATDAVAKQTVTGSRGGNAALASLMTALAAIGLFTDSTTA